MCVYALKALSVTKIAEENRDENASIIERLVVVAVFLTYGFGGLLKSQLGKDVHHMINSS